MLPKVEIRVLLLGLRREFLMSKTFRWPYFFVLCEQRVKSTESLGGLGSFAVDSLNVLL